MEEIFTRRSIRRFTDQPVEQETIEKLLRAGMQAPSAHNQQPWEFIVVREKQALKNLSRATPYAKPVAGSAVTLVLLADSGRFSAPTAWEQDMGACAQNILLEAAHLELGAVWIGIATSDKSMDYISALYRLPERIKPFALIAVGHPDGGKNEFVDRYRPERVHYEKWE